jgi:hypothetical protein
MVELLSASIHEMYRGGFMKRYAGRPLLLIAVAFLVCAVYGNEGGLQPFTATVNATEVLTPTAQPGIFTVQIDGAGSGALFGDLTFSATETIDFVSKPGTAIVTDGEFTITAANGDQLYATYSGFGVPDPDNPGFVLGTATAELTGGTGRFACASGMVSFSLFIDPAALSEVITFDTEAHLVGGHCPGR